jgi:hypothetical protein
MVDLGWQYEHGHGVTKDLAQALRLYETAVKAGVPAAMNNLGLMYLHGKGVPRDYAQARRLFEQGIALGDPATMNGLGGSCIVKATASAAMSGWPASGSRKRRRWAIPRQSKICGGCGGDGARWVGGYRA